MLKKSIYSSIFLLLAANSAFAGVMGPCCDPGKFYVGVFGGGGSTNNFNVSQFGTAYYFEEAGGPLGVNAFGNTNNRSSWLVGAQVGYQARAITLDCCCSRWSFSPAAELEAYYLDKTTFTGHLTNDEPTRLPEHNFVVTYPIERSVFLANAIFNINIPCVRLHPYVGVGFGSAIVRVSGADATQVAPPEAGVNHYNSKSSDIAPTFAGQVKVGLSYDITDCLGVFAEYRGLYLSSTHYTFGSTVFPGHPVTSSWQVRLNPQFSNMGTVGLRYSMG